MSSSSSIWQSMDKNVVGPVLQARLQAEDLSQRCRRDRYCVLCARAFCSHCCGIHHVGPGYHIVIPVAADAAGGPPAFPARYPGSAEPIEDHVAELLAAEDYATPLARDAYCINCSEAFSSRVCRHHHHHQVCGRGGFILRIEERGGRHCVRCWGDEGWFPFLESILGDPLDDEDEVQDQDDDGELTMLLPLLGRGPGTCVQCGGPVPRQLSSCCSSACAASHDRDLALRRERRDARRAARQLAKLLIVDGPN